MRCADAHTHAVDAGSVYSAWAARDAMFARRIVGRDGARYGVAISLVAMFGAADIVLGRGVP